MDPRLREDDELWGGVLPDMQITPNRGILERHQTEIITRISALSHWTPKMLVAELMVSNRIGDHESGPPT
jgi:hypothetical protein